MASKKKKANGSSGLVLVRTYSAGVHFGVLLEHKGKEVTLANARRIWRWYGANTLNEVVSGYPSALRNQRYCRGCRPAPRYDHARKRFA